MRGWIPSLFKKINRRRWSVVKIAELCAILENQNGLLMNVFEFLYFGSAGGTSGLVLVVFIFTSEPS